MVVFEEAPCISTCFCPSDNLTTPKLSNCPGIHLVGRARALIPVVATIKEVRWLAFFLTVAASFPSASSLQSEGILART